MVVQGFRGFRLLTVVNKMIAKDILATLISVWGVLVVVIVSKGFIRILDKAIEGKVSSETLLYLLGLKAITTATTLLPAALFMAVLMVLGKMYRNQEMSAIFSAGGGAGTIYRAAMLTVLPVALAAAGLSLYASPWAETQIAQLMQQDAESSDLRGIAAGKFSEYSQGDLVLYVENITKDNEMQQVFVQSRQGGLAIINAKSARLKELPDGRCIVFANGERLQGQPGNVDFVLESFDEYAVRIEESTAMVNYNRSAIPLSALASSSQLPDIAELQRRYAVPVSLVLLAFLGVPLAQSAPRGGAYGNLLIGFLIYFSYGNLTRVSQLWVTQGLMPAWLGAFGVNLLLFLLGLLLLARLYGWHWLLMRIRARLSL